VHKKTMEVDYKIGTNEVFNILTTNGPYSFRINEETITEKPLKIFKIFKNTPASKISILEELIKENFLTLTVEFIPLNEIVQKLKQFARAFARQHITDQLRLQINEELDTKKLIIQSAKQYRIFSINKELITENASFVKDIIMDIVKSNHLTEETILKKLLNNNILIEEFYRNISLDTLFKYLQLFANKITYHDLHDFYIDQTRGPGFQQPSKPTSDGYSLDDNSYGDKY
jgi:hypothetical protein